MTPKLTPAQARILKAMQEGALIWNPLEGAYHIGSNMYSWYTQEAIVGLFRRGLARSHDPSLTPAGAAALAAWEAEQEVGA